MDESTSPPAKRKPNARAGKPPAFQFYPADWLADLQVRAMTHEERGVYIDLLAYCWREGSIPTTVPDLARLLSASEENTARWWARVGPRFNPDGTHRRLDAERRKLRTFSRLQSERARKRWDAGTHNQQPAQQDPGMAPALPWQSRNDALHSASASAIPRDELPGKATEGSLKRARVDDAIGPPGRPDPDAHGGIRRLPTPGKKPIPAELQRALGVLIRKIEDFDRKLRGNGKPFDAGAWFGMGRKENRDPEAMADTLAQLIALLRTGKRPDSCFAYCEDTYGEKEANRGMMRAEAESKSRRDPGRGEPKIA